jgi:hypothetical protein
MSHLKVEERILELSSTVAAESEGSTPETSKTANEHYPGPSQKCTSKFILPWYFEAAASKKFSRPNIQRHFLSGTKSHGRVDSAAGSFTKNNGFKAAILTGNLRVSAQPLYTNDTVSQIGHDCFLPCLFQ